MSRKNHRPDMVDFHRRLILEHRLDDALISLNMKGFNNSPRGNGQRYHRHKWLGYTTALKILRDEAAPQIRAQLLRHTLC